jgi:hypothetical protein
VNVEHAANGGSELDQSVEHATEEGHIIDRLMRELPECLHQQLARSDRRIRDVPPLSSTSSQRIAAGGQGGVLAQAELPLAGVGTLLKRRSVAPRHSDSRANLVAAARQDALGTALLELRDRVSKVLFRAIVRPCRQTGVRSGGCK